MSPVVSPSENNKTLEHPPENDRQEENDPVLSPSENNKTLGYPSENDRQEETASNTMYVRRMIAEGKCAKKKEKTEHLHLLQRQAMEVAKELVDVSKDLEVGWY